MTFVPIIKRSKRSSISIKINHKQEVIVNAPKLAPNWYINTVVKSKQGWIVNTLNKMQEKYGPIVNKNFTENETFLYLGIEYPLKIVELADKPLILKEKNFVLSATHKHKAKELFEKWYVKQAKEVIGERTKIYAEKAGIEYQKIKINNAQSQWGSCSRNGRLSFTWRLIMAPIEAIDYVIAHELAHRDHMDHSPAFWSRVKEIYPDYKRQRRWFNFHGHELEI